MVRPYSLQSTNRLPADFPGARAARRLTELKSRPLPGASRTSGAPPGRLSPTYLISCIH